MNTAITEAIKGKRIIRFDYDGDERIVEPFCYGRNSKNNDVLCAFQIGGASSSGNPEGWKLYTVDKMVEVVVTANIFQGDRPKYNPNDSRMVEIYSCV